jgi:glycosyltransferase involved in cell wall biosynthesis
MAREWDEFWTVPYRQPPVPGRKKWFDTFLRVLGGGRVLPYRIDDWFDDSTILPVRKLADRLNPDIVLVEYVFVSKILDAFGSDVLKILDTHDVFGGRDQLYYKNNMAPLWFYTSEEEEKKGVDRAGIILAIQPQEAEYFKKISGKKVLVVGHLIRPLESEGTKPTLPPRLLFVGSTNHSNIDGIQWFLQNVFGIIREKSPEIELDVVGDIADSLEPSAGMNLQGTVGELTPFYKKASVVINPLQFGTGLKIKSVEALAMKRPLVTTPNGATGIEEWAGRAFLCAETPDEFAAAILQIINSEELRDTLENGAEEFTMLYNQEAFSPLEEAIDSFLSERRGSSISDDQNITQSVNSKEAYP